MRETVRRYTDSSRKLLRNLHGTSIDTRLDMHDQPIILLLITGFLGSGKTSVINSLLHRLTDTRVGLIVNDFGPITVDSQLIEQSDQVVSTTSLSGGQIFCSCLSGSFINSVEAVAQCSPDIIIVETSGLAKPAPLLEIMSVIMQRTDTHVTYAGMLCVVDAERFAPLSSSFMTLEEQIVFSDWFMINKCDLVDDKTLRGTSSRIQELRPGAPLFTTTFGVVPESLMPLLTGEGQRNLRALQTTGTYAGWGVHGRPKTCLFTIEGDYPEHLLTKFLAEVSRSMLRMKGFLSSSDGESVLFVDGVGPPVRLSASSTPISQTPGIVCIHSSALDAQHLLTSLWKHFAFPSGTKLKIT